jgi:hypothetical protein
MLHVCYGCGEYRADKIIDPSGPFGICPSCGYKHSFRLNPLLVVSGASGAGKSSVLPVLVGKVPGAVLLDSDMIWMEAFDQPEDGYRLYFETILRIAMNVGQSGLPVVLFGAGLGVPSNLEGCMERRYFSAIHYLALVCSDEELTKRLQARPEWRKSGEEENIAAQLNFNQWFKTEAGKGKPPVDLLDTTDIPAEVTAGQVKGWILKNLEEHPAGAEAEAAEHHE